ncbi:MAG: RHS repeat domain-containing protein, partial [Verrucomicrobiota bacterium]
MRGTDSGDFLRFASKTSSKGPLIPYSYTNRNQIQDITWGSVNAHYVYDRDGNESSRAPNNSTSESCTYNDVDRLTLLNHNTGSTSFSRFDYTHNSVSDCLTRTETIGSAAVLDKFAYDLDDQVTEARYNFNTQSSTQDRLCSYAYDPTGNRTSMIDAGTSTGYSVNALNQYTGAGGASMQYDPNGNLTTALVSGTSWTYTYDAQNRLVTAIDANNKRVDLAYD